MTTLNKRSRETIRVQLDDRFPDLSIKQPGWKITIIGKGMLISWRCYALGITLNSTVQVPR